MKNKDVSDKEKFEELIAFWWLTPFWPVAALFFVWLIGMKELIKIIKLKSKIDSFRE